MKTLTYCCVFISTLMYAQPHWHEGVVVLNDETVIPGVLALDHELLLMKEANKISVLPPFKVSLVRYYDEESNINRHYRSMPFGDMALLRFYEVVVYGNISVLRVPQAGVLVGNTTDDPKTFEYFTLSDGELKSFKKFRSEVYPGLEQSHPFQLNEFIHQHHLNPNAVADVIRIIRFCNQVWAEAPIAGL
jgi:hypothetical protein